MSVEVILINYWQWLWSNRKAYAPSFFSRPWSFHAMQSAWRVACVGECDRLNVIWKVCVCAALANIRSHAHSECVRCRAACITRQRSQHATRTWINLHAKCVQCNGWSWSWSAVQFCVKLIRWMVDGTSAFLKCVFAMVAVTVSGAPPFLPRVYSFGGAFAISAYRRKSKFIRASGDVYVTRRRGVGGCEVYSIWREKCRCCAEWAVELACTKYCFDSVGG